MISRALAPLLATGCLLAQAPPKFVAGDLKDLSCKVRRYGKAQDTFVQVYVEVKNRGKHTAEPLSFELTPTGRGAKNQKSVVVHRAPEPRLRRLGRGVPPGGSQRYLLQFPYWKAPSQFKARASYALFHDGAVMPEPKVKIGRLQHATYSADGRSYPLTRVKVRNETSSPLDLLFLGTFSAPIDMKGLLHLHLGAGEEKEWVIRETRTGLFEGGGIVYGARASKLQLVDWTTMVKSDPRGKDQAAAVFRAAYDRWIRWPDARVPLAGKFIWTNKGVDASGKRDESASGTFQVPSHGEPAAQFDGKVTNQTRYQVTRDLARAFADLRRPSLDALLEHNKLAQVGPEWFEFTGRGLWLHQPVSGEPRKVRYRLGGEGKITGFKQYANNPLVTWHHQEEPEGYLVSAREGLMSGSESERRTHQLLGDRFVPTSLKVDLVAKVARWDCHRLLLLSDMKWQPAADQAAPAVATKPAVGDGAAAVAALWEKPYRYPDKKVTLSARFEFKNPGTGAEWAGHRKVTGRMKLLGFVGWRRSGSGYDRAEIQLDGKLTPSQVLVLQSIVKGRLAMWASRDFAGRLAFADAFAGATITKEGATGNRFKVLNGRWARLGSNGDLIRWLEMASGVRRELRFQEIDCAWVPILNKLGRAEIAVRWRKVTEGWLLPVEIKYKRVLGEEFGTESLKLTSVRLE